MIAEFQYKSARSRNLIYCAFSFTAPLGFIDSFIGILPKDAGIRTVS